MKIFSLMDRRNNVRILTVLGMMLMSSVRLMADSFTIDGINYSTTSDTEVEVTGGSVTGALDIPSVVTYGEKQYDVTSIGNSAFQYNYYDITSVHIPGSVKTIGSRAFYDNYYMSSIVIDEGVDRIESDAFGYNGNYLGANSCSLSLPNSITYIGTKSFQNNGCFNIKTLDLPKSLTTIENDAFRNCSSNLEEIIIHSSVTNIGNNAFGDLNSGKLSSVWVLSPSIPETSENPFGGYQSNATLYVPSSLLESYRSADYWKDFAKFENCNNHPEYMIPIVVFDRTTWQISISCPNPDATIYFTKDDTTPTISSDTYTSPFFYDGNITVVKAIAVCEGFDNSEVVSLNLDTSSLFLTPQPVVTMSSDFKVTMKCAMPGATIYYHYGEFESWRDENYRISNSTLYEGPFTLPYGTKLSVEAIADGYAPSGWTTVDYYTNYYVEQPYISSEQVIDETYRTVKSRTVSIDYHPTNTYGGTGAYYTIDGSDPNTSSTRVQYTEPFTVDRNCTVRAVAYKDGRINSQITEHSIGDVDSQFKVGGIYYNKAENTIGDYVEVTTGGLPYTGDIVIPETVKDAAGTTYKVIRIGRNAFAHNYDHDITSISLPATIESIGEYAFNDCDNITSITLPSGVKSIERYAFNDCNNLEDISLGESLVSIGECAFYNCRNLTSLSLPATLREIKSQAFNCCDGLTTIELPNAIHTIGYFAFGNCNNLSTITMPNSLTSIGEYAFTNCDKLTSIAIPEGVTVIPSHCFQYCRSLASVTLPSTLQEIKDYAFRECDALTTVDLPRTLTSIGQNVFESCDKLTSIAIPEGVTVIPSSAFWYCRSLTSVKLPSTVKEIRYGAFYYCDNLTTINLPSNVQSIGGQAFSNCSDLTSINLPASLTSLEYNVFEQCQKLTSIVIPDGVTVIPSSAFYNCSSLASVTLPSTLKTINSSAFYGCSSLNSIILPASLTEIYDNAFNGCSALTAVYSYASNPPVLLNQPHAFTGVVLHANLYVNSEEAVNIYMGAHIWQDFLSVGTVGVLPCTFQLNNCSLSISSQTEGASIHYTRDGSEPTASSILYEGPIDFLVSDTIRAIAVKEGLGNSPVAVFQQELKVESPVVSIDKDLVITITPAEKPSEKLADVRYYYNYSEERWGWPVSYSKPEEVIANCTLYTEPLHPEKPGRMRVYALRDGWTMSATEFNYFDGYYLDSPNINWNSETHVFSITHNTSGVVIYYTLDGSDPRTSETRIKYDAPFAVDRNTTLRAVAIKDGTFDAQVAEQSVSNVGKQFKVDDIYYTLAENSIGNCVEVTTGARPYTGDIVIPKTVTDADGITYTVVRIGRNAFNHSNGHDIKSISLPATIESIGEYAFNDCDSITSITLPSGVKSIERYAFNDCNNLEEINLGESLVNLGEYAFAYCRKLTRLSLPATLQEIKSHAFYECDGLTSIELPDAIHTIGSSAFAGCDNLSTITMPSSLTSLGENAFSTCGKLTSIAIPEGVTVIPSNCFQYCRSLASVTLPSTLQEIKNYAFHECDALTTIDLPDAVHTLGNYAICNCSNLISVSMPDALTSMGYNVFESCDKLTSIAIPEGVTVIPSSAFWNCRSLTSVKLPSTVKEIRYGAFYYCDNLTAINLPSNVQSIGGQAFYRCSNLTSINLPASLKSLEYNVFEQCSKLTSIAIPEGVTDIPSSAFSGCSSLTSIILPASLKNIYENAFNGCSALTSVYSYASNPPAVLNQPHAFTGVLTNANLYVSPEAVNTYKDATIWQDFLSVGTVGVLPCAFQLNNCSLSISSQTEGASIYYTRDGSEPTASSILYEGPIDFLVSDTIRAIAVKEGLGNSPVSVFRQELKVESPMVSIDKDLVITITPAEKPSEKLADVRYYYSCSENRWNWPELYSKPEDVIANCTLYTGPVHPLQSGRMRVYALRDGWMMSETDFDYSSDAYYTDSPYINASYNGSNCEVTISHNTEGVVIYYTLDGTDPNTSDSRKVYTEPIILATNTRILAVATLKDHFNSSVSEHSNGRWYSFEQNGIYYRITGDTEVTVSGGSATGALDIPEKVSYGEKQYAVTSIMNDAFSYNNNIASVHIPGSVKTIGSYAFYYNSYMSSIVIDEGVERIEYNAFGYNGNSLGANSCSLSLPNSITYIDSDAFQNNGHLNITTLDLPDSLTYIGYEAFRQCSSNVTEIVIKGKVESIGNNAFGYLNNLKSVYVLTPQIPKTDEGDPFNGGQSEVTLYASPSLLESYKTADYWKSFGGYESYTNPVIRFNTDIWQISMACYNPGSKIYYTTDGTEPSGSSSLYTAPFKYDGNISVIKAVSVCNGENSDVITLTIDKAFVPTPKPTVSLSSDFKVTMECPIPGARIYYQYNDYSWKDENTRIAESTLYDGPFTLTYGTHIYVEAIADGYAGSGWSDINYSSGYYVSQPDIFFEKAADSKSGKVTIDYHSDWSDGGSEAYYTLDGSDPSTSATRIKYSSPFDIDRNCTVRAVAYKEGRLYSQIREEKYSDIDSQFKVDGIYYNLAENTIGNAVEVTHGALSYVGDIVIPETVTKEDGTQFTVVRIGNDAFSRNYGNEITSISLPATIQSIGDNAFYNCDKLVSIVLPDGVKSIGREAFWNCYNLEDISLGTSLEYLGQNAFASCNKLLSIKLPDTLKSLASGIFQNCNKLTSIAIPEGVSVIPSYLFSGCSNLISVSLPSTLKTIEYNAFNNCNNLTSIILPASLTAIEQDAFNGCSSIKSVYSYANVPPTLRNEPHAFKSILTKATLYVNSEAVNLYKDTKIWLDFLSVEPMGQLPCAIPTFILHDYTLSITSHTDGASIYYTRDGSEPSKSSTLYKTPIDFLTNDTIRAIAIKDGMINSPVSIFIKNDFMTERPEVNISDDMVITITSAKPSEKLAEAQYYYSYSQDRWNWPQEYSNPEDVLTNCTLYREPLHFDYPVQMRVYALRDGWAMSRTDFNFFDNYYLDPPSIVWNSDSREVSISHSTERVTIYYTHDGSDPYTSDTRAQYTNPFTVDRNCKIRAMAIKKGAFDSEINEITISDVDSQFKVDGIYYNLAENTIGNFVEVTTGGVAYTGDIVIPDTVNFADTKFTVVRIGSNAFNQNNGHNIASVKLPSTIQSIGQYAFNNCKNLIAVNLPAEVTSIESHAFSGCYNLEDISLGEGLINLGDNAFANCNKLISINLPATLKSIGNSAFRFCNSLTSIAIPEGITVIPSSAFDGCSSLLSVSLPSTLKIIESQAFNSCSELTTIFLPASMTDIYYEAFNECSSLISVYSYANVPPELRNEPHAFVSILTNATLYVNSEAVSGYKGKKIWQDFLSVKPIDLIPCNPPTFSCENFIMTISCSTPGAVIYYTVDGTDPSKSATRIQYTEPFEFALNGVPLYAVATKDGMKDSDKSVYSRNLVVSNPVIYRNGKQLTITNQTPNAKIYYVVRKEKFGYEWEHYSDGLFNGYDRNTMFGEFHLYEGVTSIPYAGTIYAIAKRDGWGDSQCMYLDTGDGMNLNPPTISCDDKTRTVTITHNNDDVKDAKCYYTLNGEDPNYSSAIQLYEKPFTIDRNYTIQAIVTEEEKYFNSSIAKKDIDWFQTTKPEIKITVLPDDNKVMAEIVCQGENDSIFYSTSASVDKKSPVYKEPFELTSISATITTISAIAVRNGWKDSEKASFTFRKPDYTCKTPTFTENKKDSTLSISSSEGASIYYTVDGKTPSKQSAKYTAPIKIEHNQTIRAIAYHSNLLTSQEGEHDISWVEMNSPRIVINGNMCTITSDKPGATIRYALSDDHLRDTQIDYQVYSGPFQLSKKQTDIGAYATLTNYNDSKVAWKTFTPGEDASCQKPQIIRDGETDYVIMSSGTDDAVIYYTLNGLTPNTKSDKYTGPIPVSSNVTVKAMSTADGYFDSDITSFDVDWFTLPVPEISIDGNCAIISCLSTEATIYYTLDGKNPTTKSAVYTEPVLLTGNVEIRAMAVLKGWNNSDVAVFTPNSFVCDEVQFDYDGFYLILSTDDGSTIHYTTDGSEPTEEGLTYTEPIVISDFITVKAMSSKPFYADSPVSSYEITFISDGEDATINCEAGQLQKIINQTGSSDGLTALTIKGSINQADLAFIRTVESLEHLDLTETTVDEFGFQDNAFEGMNLISFSSPKSHVKVGEHIFQDCDGMAAIVWNMDESVPENLLEDTDNPNMLLYVNAITYKPKSYNGNLISGGQANEIVLVDSETGGNFYCPQRFYAKKISFTRSFEQMTEIGITQGWETIALPFDVKTITHETKGALAPFAKGLDKDEYKPFWLCELTSTGFIDASEIKAYTPYLICMPNNSNYADDYILSGKVTFSSEEIYIDENQDNASIKGSVNFTTSLQRRAADPSVMNINLEEIIDESGDYHRTGSAFISGLRETRPFEASAVINVSLSSLRVDNISNGFVTDILKTYSDDLLLKSGIGIYDTDGRKLDVDDLNSLRLQIDTEKIYIVNGQKVLVTPLR